MTKKMLSIRLDPLSVGVVLAMLIPLLVPLPMSVAHTAATIGNAPIFMLFLLYGMRLPTGEVIGGFTNWRLQLATLASTWLLFPLIVVPSALIWRPTIGDATALGFMYLAWLPSTVNSSITFTSIARGNIPGAITAATASNIAGMFITPMIAMGFLGASGATSSTNMNTMAAILSVLLLPFIIGSLVQPWVGPWVRRQARWTRWYEIATIVFIVFRSVLEAQELDVFATMGAGHIALIGVLSLGIILIMLVLTWRLGGALGFPYGDKVALMMCGTKKSLATGLPMALVLFDSSVVGVLVIPMIVFHQLQLLVCAYVARRFGMMVSDS